MTVRTKSSLAAISVLCFIAIAHGQVIATRPDALSGPWEFADPSGVHGIFVRIYGRGIDARAIRSQTIHVSVYHRKNDRETRGWYVVFPPRDTSVEFDGRRLRVVGLTAIFDQDADRWSGSWSIDGQTNDIALGRPHPAAGATVNRLCGDWEGLVDARGLASTRLHIVQSSDGAVVAWMDRVHAVIGLEHYGESLRVLSADPSRIVLELESPIGPQYRFNGVLSPDGTSITGNWNGLNARKDFHRVR